MEHNLATRRNKLVKQLDEELKSVFSGQVYLYSFRQRLDAGTLDISQADAEAEIEHNTEVVKRRMEKVRVLGVLMDSLGLGMLYAMRRLDTSSKIEQARKRIAYQPRPSTDRKGV